MTNKEFNRMAIGHAMRIEEEVAALENAGWVKVMRHVWKSPSGALFAGPHGAYEYMQKYPQLSVPKISKEVSFKPETEMPLA